MIEPRARSIKRWILGGAIGAGALGLLGGGTWIVYSAYTKLAATLHEVQRAYAAEQARTRTLTLKGEELSKALEQAQARATALQEKQERLKGWLTKAEKELQMKAEWQGWGKGFLQGLYKIFF